MKVRYQYLSAEECESLKKQVQNRETEFVWGTYDEEKGSELSRYSIDDLSTQHLENILITQPQVGNELAAAILMLLKKRYQKYGLQL